MKRLLLALLCICARGNANIENHLKKIENKRTCSDLRNIDYIYMINLDQRIERWINSLKQLGPYGIVPQRFSAIYGWTLKPDVLNDIGLKFQLGMWTGRENVMVFPPEKEGTPGFLFLNGSSVGTACFSGWTVKGTIGCTLSHLSVLKDALDSGYRTVWILEDDIQVIENPHQLSGLIDELNQLVGVDGWDALYTDYDYLVVDPSIDILEQVPALWRPDMPNRELSFLGIHVPLNEHFVKIGSRNRAHSIIYSRTGIEKIMRFYQTHDNFLPYDQELALIPGINTYVLTKPIVSVHETNSDTRAKYFN